MHVDIIPFGKHYLEVVRAYKSKYLHRIVHDVVEYETVSKQIKPYYNKDDNIFDIEFIKDPYNIEFDLERKTIILSRTDRFIIII